MLTWWVNRAIDVAMIYNRWRLRTPLLQSARHPQVVQSDLLSSILEENANTEFGRRFNFSGISNLSEYQQRVPVHDYDKLEPYIKRQIAGKLALTTDHPEYYARTSGTTGRYKDIPLTAKGLQQVSRAQKQLALSLWQDTNFFKGQVLGFAGIAEEGKLQNGISYGSVSGTTYKSLSPVVAKKFAVPSDALLLEDIESRYQVFALTVLGSDQITGVVTANPSSMLKLVRLINSRLSELLAVFDGSIPQGMTDDVRVLLPGVVARANPDHIAGLLAEHKLQGCLQPEQLFPALSTVACWTGGSCGTAISQLRPFLPGNVRFVEYGYGASEFMGSVNVDAVANRCLPQLTEHVYEFVKREQWESGEPQFFGPHELLAGQDYYVFVTTRSGLYRYHINDIVRAGEYVENCATIRFLQKGKGVTNITGEKLSEYQLIEALDCCSTELGLSAGGYLALANEEEARYDLYIESIGWGNDDDLGAAVDSKLRSLNSEYDDKRNSDRLKVIRVFSLIDGAMEQIKQWSIESGVREVQYKPTVLDYASGWQEKLKPLVGRS